MVLISLIGDIEHVFIYLFAIFMSSLETFLFGSFNHFCVPIVIAALFTMAKVKKELKFLLMDDCKKNVCVCVCYHTKETMWSNKYLNLLDCGNHFTMYTYTKSSYWHIQYIIILLVKNERITYSLFGNLFKSFLSGEWKAPHTMMIIGLSDHHCLNSWPKRQT